ncbi:MAG: hypothetical protein K0R59_3315 [Sphingobacterium sp.]|jgi:hypothetical protein|nr:hypothetical protein [Sphingobacterium sp.]
MGIEIQKYGSKDKELKEEKIDSMLALGLHYQSLNTRY